MTIGRDAIPSRVCMHTGPVGKRAPRLFEDGLQGGTIPDIQYRIEHDLSPTSGHQDMTIAIPPGALQARLLLQGLERRSAPLLIERAHTGGQDNGFL